MCEHHACFHEGVNKRDEPAASRVSVQQQILDAPMQSGNNGPSLLQPASITQVNASRNMAAFWENRQLSAQSSIPATADPNVDRHTQRAASLHNDELPDIPSQCLLPSNVSSARPSLVGDAAPATRPGNTHKHASYIDEWIPDPPKQYSFPESLTDIMSFNGDGTFKRTQQAESVRGPQLNPASQSVSQRTRNRTTAELPIQTALVLRPNSQENAPAKKKIELETPSTSLDIMDILPHLTDIHDHYAAKPTLNDRLQNHEDRIDTLENATHGHHSVVAATESERNCDCDCDLLRHNHEKHESRIKRIENALSAKKIRGFAQLEEGGSFLSEASQSTTNQVELYSRMDSRVGDIETRLSRLDDSTMLPSAANPWEFEVVFLPFGADLTRIWGSLDNFNSQMSRRSSTAELGSSQFHRNASATRFYDRAPKEQSWGHFLEQTYSQADLLSARACGSNSLVDQRLHSRGLVRSVFVKGADAQHVQYAVSEAFGDLLQTMADGPSTNAKMSTKVPKKLRRYRDALNNLWLPLRKLHKDSKLRFLETSEMMSCSLWTPTFLDEIAMHQGDRRRLFITSQASYTQHPNNLLPGSGWTWETIRQLPQYDENASQNGSEYEFRPSQSHKADDMILAEPCWDWDEKLDGQMRHTHQTVTTVPLSGRQPLSTRASLHSDEEEEDQSSSIHSSPASDDPLHYTPSSELPRYTRRRLTMSPSPMTPLTTRNLSFNAAQAQRARDSRSPYPDSAPIRSNSEVFVSAQKRMNPYTYSSIFPDSSKRRSTSGISATASSSPMKPYPSGSTAMKRQRTRSPSRPRDTPRWSVGRESPFVYEDEIEAGVNARKRGMTPFAYATPFSMPLGARQRSVSVKRERSWGSGIGVGGVTPWDEHSGSASASGAENEDEGGSDGEFFQARQPDDGPAALTGDETGWEGMEDDEYDEDDDLEARALTDNEDNKSEGIEAPSEYPSTQQGDGQKSAFKIHADEQEQEQQK